MRSVEKIIKDANRTWRLKSVKMYFRPITAIVWCLKLTAVTCILFVISYCFCEHDSFVYSLMFALFTGVVASSFVTIAVEMNNNNQRNKKRWVKLQEYFRYIISYQSDIEINIKVSKELEAEDIIDDTEYEEPRLAAWRRIIKEAQPSSSEEASTLTKNEYEYAAIVNQIVKGVSIFETVYTEAYDLLSNRELETIGYILSDIKFIKNDVELLIRQDVDINKFYAEAHEKGALAYIEAERRYETSVQEHLGYVFPEIIARPDFLESYGELFNGVIFAFYLQDCDKHIRSLEAYIYDEPGYGALLEIRKQSK